MFDYLQQFNKLPKELREKVSSPAAMEILSSLENKYGVSLAMVVMQVMIKQILVKDLSAHFITELGMATDKAQSLSRELQERLLFNVSSYLGLRITPVLSTEDKELEQLMKDNGIILPSQDLVSRCRQILLTYRKGIRTKIDARAALEKAVDQGGLSLDALAADRLLRALDRPTVAPQMATPALKPVSSINDLINKNEAVAAYDLKSALAKGQVKPPEALADKYKLPKLDASHEISAPKPELSIAAPEEVQKLMHPTVPVQAPVQPMVKPEVKTEAKPIVPTIKPQVETKPEEIKTVVKEEREEKPASITSPSKTGVKAGLWSKLFKESGAKAVTATAAISTQHLEEAVKAAVAANNLSARPAASSQSRPKMDDVKVKPKVMGPLEELRFLDVVNFRRLGGTPKECAAKVVMKIKLLEKDGYDRMVEGVKAWRQSPVNRLYVRLAQEAVVMGVTLRDAVAARLAEGKEVLTMEEIEAIVAMNNQLMF